MSKFKPQRAIASKGKPKYIKKQHKVKKMRKSSLSKATKNFQIFNQDNEIINKYETLLDLADDLEEELKITTDNRFLALQDDDDGNDNSEVNIDSDEFGSITQEPTPILSNYVNQLESNHDFIAFSASSEEDQDDEINEGEINESKMSDDDSEYSKSERTLNLDYPWLLNHDHSKQKEVADWLTMEIKDFVSYISPSREEIELRNKTISNIRNAVKDLWSDADLQVFGSYATDLYLPGSDIDCVINSRMKDKENRNDLYSLASHLKHNNLATHVEVIAKARVPIIKFIEPHSQIHIDVSFERNNGLEAAKLIREWLSETPGLRELVLIIKQFLGARRLNNVHTGGLGGFSIICLIYSFLNLHPRIVTNEIDPLDNLGVLLIDFFELYGKNFGYDDVAISIGDGRAEYIPKHDFKQSNPVRTSFSLAIQDPGDPYNNISRGSFNLRDIKKSFSGAFDLVVNKCFAMESATFKDRIGQSILGNIIKYRGSIREFKDERDLVENKAIIENEKYHKKRSRIVHEDVFLNPSSDSEPDLEEEEEMYHIQEPVPKKKKKGKERLINPVVLIAQKKAKIQNSITNSKPSKMKLPKNVVTVDSFMGLFDEDENDDFGENNSQSNIKLKDGKKKLKISRGSSIEIDEEKSDMKKVTVDAQTRRDYWLSKGQSMSTAPMS